MGRGNWHPNLYEYQMVYVDLDADDEFAYGHMKENLMCLLPPSYTMANQWRFDRERFVLAENEFCEVLLADNETTTAVCFIGKEHQVEDRRYRNYDRTAKRVFRMLSDCYELYERDGAWLQRRYVYKHNNPQNICI